MLLATFGVGTERQLSSSVAGQTQVCGASIPMSWLMSGSLDDTQRLSAATDEERRAAAACGPVVRESRTLTLSAMGVGGLLALVGWTATSLRGEAASSTRTHARA